MKKYAFVLIGLLGLIATAHAQDQPKLVGISLYQFAPTTKVLAGGSSHVEMDFAYKGNTISLYRFGANRPTSSQDWLEVFGKPGRTLTFGGYVAKSGQKTEAGPAVDFGFRKGSIIFSGTGYLNLINGRPQYFSPNTSIQTGLGRGTIGLRTFQYYGEGTTIKGGITISHPIGPHINLRAAYLQPWKGPKTNLAQLILSYGF